MSVRFDRENVGAGPRISGFVEGGFRIDGEVHEGGVLLTPQGVQRWDAPALDALVPADVEHLLALAPAPEFLLIGTGAALARPPRAFVEALEARGIGVEPMDSRAAARAWMVLRAEDRWIAAALFPLNR